VAEEVVGTRYKWGHHSGECTFMVTMNIDEHSGVIPFDEKPSDRRELRCVTTRTILIAGVGDSNSSVLYDAGSRFRNEAGQAFWAARLVCGRPSANAARVCRRSHRPVCQGGSAGTRRANRGEGLSVPG
jgi:hypothetical protein